MRGGGPSAYMRGIESSGPSNKEELIFYDFILAFYRFQGILYTKIGIDELEDLKSYLYKLMREYF